MNRNSTDKERALSSFNQTHTSTAAWSSSKPNPATEISVKYPKTFDLKPMEKFKDLV
jgi:DNA polymerase I-like protein with 3'-5' exonuclease and polymerase domains